MCVCVCGMYTGAIDPGLPDGIMTNHHSPGYSDTPESASPYQQQPQQPLDVLQVSVVSLTSGCGLYTCSSLIGGCGLSY